VVSQVPPAAAEVVVGAVRERLPLNCESCEPSCFKRRHGRCCCRRLTTSHRACAGVEHHNLGVVELLVVVVVVVVILLMVALELPRQTIAPTMMRALTMVVSLPEEKKKTATMTAMA